MSLIRPRVMGILNVTPDSFSDGGLHASVEGGLAQAMQLIGDGADILDIGGESTRPGAAPVDVEEEIARTVPVIEGLRARWTGPIGIDTMKPEVARAAIAAGATMWNDVTALGHALDSLAARLSDQFETRVKIALGKSKGRLTVEFASVQDLNRILATLSPDDPGLLRE